ncbi:hypothetical protein [Hazenella coriacea]|uniref:hypothetical protein n=1 Tax=Hazenella coriacea TaxID=1179467 RepID=UPI00104F4E31|nr:hypothetical protein [Hazenella coriacea]
MKLYFLNECLGEIVDISVEGLWTNGKIIPTKKLEKFKDFFEGLIDEENEFVEEKYNEEWLDDHNWFIVDDENRKKGIYLPAVYFDGDINWRWR